MEKFRSKNFNLVLYEEDETHKNAIEKIKVSYDYALICHDRDYSEETGEILKPHYHIVLRFPNQKWNTALAEELGIAENYIEESRSLKRSLLYLIHYYDENKFQYSIDDVEGPMKKRLKELLNNEGKTESEKVMEIFDEIDNTDGEIPFKSFVRHIASKGYWSVLRSSTGLIMRYLDEHNHDM